MKAAAPLCAAPVKLLRDMLQSSAASTELQVVTHSSTLLAQPHICFLDTPPELRNHIYAYAVCVESQTVTQRARDFMPVLCSDTNQARE